MRSLRNLCRKVEQVEGTSGDIHCICFEERGTYTNRLWQSGGTSTPGACLPGACFCCSGSSERTDILVPAEGAGRIFDGNRKGRG